MNARACDCAVWLEGKPALYIYNRALRRPKGRDIASLNKKNKKKSLDDFFNFDNAVPLQILDLGLVKSISIGFNMLFRSLFVSSSSTT